MLSIFSEFREKVLKGFLGKWLDFKPFLKQRKEIIYSKTINFSSKEKEQKQWMLPLEFSIQGLVLCTFIITLTGTLFSTFVKERPLILMEVIRESKSASLIPKEIKQKEFVSEKINLIENYGDSLSKKLNVIRQSNDSIFAKPIPYSEQDNHMLFILSVAQSMDSLKKNDAIIAYEKEINALQYQKNALEWQKTYEETYSKFKYVIVPLALLLAALFFKILMRKKIKLEEMSNKLSSHYLYFFTAYLFWIIFTLSIMQAIKFNVNKYFPPQMSQIVSDLESSLNQEFINLQVGLYINTFLFIIYIVLITKGLKLIKSVSKQLSNLYNSSSPELAIKSKTIFWRIIWANLFSSLTMVFILLFLTSIVKLIKPIVENWKI
ncbi:hypothetical protein [Aquimarina rhabdastrellae]